MSKLVIVILLAFLFTFIILFFELLGFFGIPLFEYGKGQTEGIVTTVEEGLFWNTVWIRASEETSNTDPYSIIKSNKETFEEMTRLSKSVEKTTIKFKKFLIGGDVVFYEGTS